MDSLTSWAWQPSGGQHTVWRKDNKNGCRGEETLLGFTEVDSRLSHLCVSVQRTDFFPLMLPLGFHLSVPGEGRAAPSPSGSDRGGKSLKRDHTKHLIPWIGASVK